MALKACVWHRSDVRRHRACHRLNAGLHQEFVRACVKWNAVALLLTKLKSEKALGVASARTSSSRGESSRRLRAAHLAPASIIVCARRVKYRRRCRGCVTARRVSTISASAGVSVAYPAWRIVLASVRRHLSWLKCGP